MGLLAENRSQTLDTFALFVDSGSQGTFASSTVDTSTHSRGVTFIAFVPFALSITESWTFVINESDDSGMSGSNVVDDDRLTTPISGIAIGDPSDTGDILKAIGVFTTKRFINIEATNVQGTNQLIIVSRAISDNQPVVNV